MKKNLKVLLTIGIPASGKTTWCKEFISKNERWVRVCRDDFRKMLFNREGLLPFKEESAITDMVDKAILTALKYKINVVVDETFTKESHIKRVLELVKYKADVDFQIFDISLKKAIERNSLRDNPVPEKVMKEQYGKYTNLFQCNFNFSMRKIKPVIVNNNKLVKGDKLPKAIIYDLDGTLAHANNKRGIFDWNKVDLDDIDEKVRETLYLYQKQGYKIVLMSGRAEDSREKTIEWLDNHNITYDDLILKPSDDMRKDTISKKALYEKYIEGVYDVNVIFEDRAGVVKMWRDLGIRVFQVLDGDY